MYIVLFLHQTTTQRGCSTLAKGCISYYSYIKPQPQLDYSHTGIGCISYYSYIKPQPGLNSLLSGVRCISYYSYIKPQPVRNLSVHGLVVYRTIPTSNHNLKELHLPFCKLYIVLFLHQTTTRTYCVLECISCISYYSYIKPQLPWHSWRLYPVVYRTIPTSNHNL